MLLMQLMLLISGQQCTRASDDTCQPTPLAGRCLHDTASVTEANTATARQRHCLATPLQPRLQRPTPNRVP
eukprot:97311-Lingulodinium_polyedra.AAC.1